MILRFEVNQAEAFRRGVDVPKSTNHLEVNPADLTQEDRNLIADRLKGIDVMELAPDGQQYGGSKIVANLPTYEALMEAIRDNQKTVAPKNPNGLVTSVMPLGLGDPQFKCSTI